MGFHDPSLSRSIFLCCEKILKMGQIMYFKGTVKEKKGVIGVEPFLIDIIDTIIRIITYT